MDIEERKRLIEQVRKEIIEELKQYHIGWCHNGEMIALKSSKLDGQVFVVPDDKYKQLLEI